MTRNWENVFQGGQGLTPAVIAMLRELEAELAANYAASVHSVSAADASVTVGGTANDPTLSASGGGGSQTVKRVRVPVAFDTAGLVLTPGIVVYTPTAGDAMLNDLCFISIPTPFDGTDTTFNFTYSDLASAFQSNNIAGLQDVAAGDDHSTIPIVTVSGAFAPFSQSGPWIFPDATPLRLIVDDGAGGDPGMSAGSGEIVLTILAAA